MKLLHRSPAHEFSGRLPLASRVVRVLEIAREEARRLRHDTVDAEHILLGIVRFHALLAEGRIREDQGGPVDVMLGSVPLDTGGIRDQLEHSLRPGAGTGSPILDKVPYTHRARAVMVHATDEAQGLGDPRVGTHHLLLGILRENGVAARVLQDAGLTLDRARALIRGRPPLFPQEPSPGFTFHVDHASSQSIYEQIIDQVRDAVASGRLRPGDRLPTVRQLAGQLAIAPGTVARGYSDLERHGVVVTKRARGTRVAARRDASSSQEKGAGGRESAEALVGLLRPVVVAVFHRGGSAQDLRRALEEAMRGILTASASAPPPSPD